MIVKFFEYRGSSGKACVEYLIGQNGRREGASVLFGNPVLTANIIDNLKFKRKFTAGCLAIQEKNISKVTIDAIIGCFQSIICTGLWPTQLSFLWVQHLDKENLELNFVIPHVDLISRRSLTPYLRRFDGKYISVFEDFINDSLKISSPRNPFCMLGMAVGKFATSAQKKRQEKLHIILMNQIDQKRVRSEEDLLSFFISYNLRLIDRNKRSMRFKSEETGEQYFFKGGLYCKGFDYSRQNQMEWLQVVSHFSRRLKSHVENANNTDVDEWIALRAGRLKYFDPSREYKRQMEVHGYGDWLALKELSLANINSPTPTPTPTLKSDFSVTPTSEEVYEDQDPMYLEYDEYELSDKNYSDPEDATDDYDFSP